MDHSEGGEESSFFIRLRRSCSLLLYENVAGVAAARGGGSAFSFFVATLGHDSPSRMTEKEVL